jgi:hypothetical protein
MTITLVLWQIVVLTLLILIAGGTLSLLVIRTGLAEHRRWSELSLSLIGLNGKNLLSTDWNESGSETTKDEWAELFKGPIQILPESELIEVQGFTPYQDAEGLRRQSSTGTQPSGTSFTEDIVPLRQRPAKKGWLRRKVGR